MNRARIASLFLLSITIVLAIPRATLAEDTCCLCKMTSDASSESTCFKIDATKLKDPNNCKTFPSETGMDDDWTCTRKLGANECQPILSGGACALGPQTVAPAQKGEAVQSSGSAGTQTSADTSGALMEFNTDIPGFKNPEDQSLLFGAYVAAIYRYSLSIVTIMATVMFIWGAFLYLVGSSVGNISNGKSIMIDAIIGMILLFSANLILRTINPALVTFKSLDITQITTTPYSSAYHTTSFAPELLTELGAPPTGTGTGSAPTFGIPLECPTRTITYKGKSLTADIINKYLAEQERTGVPAGVIMAQINNESGGACPVVNLFDEPSTCGGLHSKYYNFGGVGCTQKQVPKDACAHLGFPKGFLGGSKGQEVPLSVEDVNKYWNSGISPNCVKLLNEGATRDTYTNCGDSCYPQKSHTVFYKPGVSGQIWVQSVQCSRKFNNAQAFLDYHLRIIKPCLPYNNSVYSFAYCIGASNYAGSTLKAKVLADYIEKNCLCDPSKDARKCVRDKKLEQDISNAIVKKTKFQGKDPFTTRLWKATGGRLVPTAGEAFANDEAAAEGTK